MDVVSDVHQLAVLRVAMGALGGYIAIAMSLASLVSPPDRATRVISLVQSAQILGLMFGPVLGGLIAGRLGLRAAFAAAGVITFLAGLNMLLMYREPPALAQQRARNRAEGVKMSFRAMLRLPFFVPLLVILCAANFTDRSFQPLIPSSWRGSSRMAGRPRRRRA